MGTLNTTVFARNRNRVNTYIGGISSDIYTPALLASLLGIMENQILLFQVVGDDIQCSIKDDFTLPLNFLYPNLKTTYFKSSKVVNLQNNSFRGNENINELEFINIINLTGKFVLRANYGRALINLPNMAGCGDDAFYGETQQKEIDFYIPKCTSLGSSVLENGVFYIINPKSTIYAHPSLQTNNSGNPDGDLQYAISRGVTVRFVTNFTAPNTPVVSVTNIYDTAVEVSFTPPSSTNAIDYYEIYLNGMFFKKYYSSSFYLTNLNELTGYSLQVIAVDVFFNKSEISVSVPFTTNTTAFPFSILNSGYYKLDTNSNDSSGNSRNGTDTSMTYSGGYAKFVTGYIDIADNDAFSFTDGKTDTSAHIAFGFIWNDKTGSFQFFLNKRGVSTNMEWILACDSSNLNFHLYSQGVTSAYISISIPKSSISASVLNTLQYSYDGLNKHTGLKAYLNGSSIGTSSMTGIYMGQVNGTSQVRIGAQAVSTPFYFKGDMKHLSIWKNRKMTPSEITEIDYRIKNNIPLI